MNKFDQAVSKIKSLDFSMRDSEDSSHLFVEYLARARNWKEYLKIEPIIIFFDVTKYLSPGFQVTEEQEEVVENLIESLRGYNASICASYVKLAALEDSGFELPDIPMLYEPLIELLERNGGVVTLNGFIEISGKSFYLKDWDA